VDSQVHNWVVYWLGVLLGSVGHRVKIHKITPVNGDLEIKDSVVLQNLPPPRTLILDFTMTHIRFGRSNLHPNRQLTHTRSSDGAPDPDGALKTVVRVKIRHYRQLYLNRPDTIVIVSVSVDTSGRIYDDFSRLRLLFLHVHREASALPIHYRRNRINVDSFTLFV
jgi:hypothetical protein